MRRHNFANQVSKTVLEAHQELFNETEQSIKRINKPDFRFARSKPHKLKFYTEWRENSQTEYGK